MPLVRASWIGTPLLAVPIQCSYQPEQVERSHFRPVWDLAHITIMNIGLVLQSWVVPLSLRHAGVALGDHWHIYLPVMLGSFALMMPAILIAERRGQVKAVFVGSIALLLVGQLTMPWLLGGIAEITVFLLIFFTAFNVLEAMLPSLTSKLKVSTLVWPAARYSTALAATL